MSKSKSKGGFLEGISSLFRKGDSQPTTNAATPDEFKASASELKSAVDALKNKINSHREELSKQSRALSEAGSEVSVPSSSSGPSKLELQKQELESAITQMRSSIADLHAKLKTGLNADTISGLEDSLSDVSENLQGEDLDSRIRAAIVERVHSEIGPLAWQITMHLMERGNVKWPEPGGLIPGASEEQKANVIRHHISDSEALFLANNLKSSIKNMVGVVSAWKKYPDNGSWLWQEVAIRGVACGVRCQILKGAIDKLRADGETLRATANKILDEHLSKIQSLLQTGIHSLEDAEKVTQGVDGVVKGFLPDLAWKHVKDTVNKEAALFEQA